jgi:putative FmdB family regulatory protein
MSSDNGYGYETVIIGDITKPGYDYRCEECAEIFEVHYGRDEKPLAVTCPICKSGRTSKIMSVPALRVRWKNALASNEAMDMAPRFYKRAKNRALEGR